MSGTPRHLWVDASLGAAGDMILGALVDLGVPLGAVRNAVASLPVEGWRISTRIVQRCGLRVRRVNVRVPEEGPHRRWSDIRRILSGGGLDPSVRKRALRIFRRLFEAEAEVHGADADTIHLHEAGAVDAIVDVVGACVGLARLAPERIVVSSLVTGTGTVRCAHGTYPVPAPATLALVRGVPVSGGGLEGERLTPTGAAILTEVADAWGGVPLMRPERLGYGAGQRDPGSDPNALRMVLGPPIGPREEKGGETLVLQFTVDDATPQVLAYASERLFEAGALEVYTVPAHMKKGRSGHLVTVLGRPGDLDALSRVVLAETTTLGLRHRIEGRIESERESRIVRTRFGPIRIKVGTIAGRPVHAWPEYDDCAAAARKRKAPLKAVQQAALEAYAATPPRRSNKPTGTEKETEP